MTMEFAIQRLSGEKTEKLSAIEKLWAEDGAHDDDAFEFVPTKIVIASSGANAFQAGEDEFLKAPLDAFVIDSVRTRAYYPSPNGSKIPLCSSVGAKYGSFSGSYLEDDLKAADEFAPPHPAIDAIRQGGKIEDFYECKNCPMSVFGSALNSGGQACKIKQRLLVLPEGWSTPAILILPTMSVTPWNKFCSMLQSVHHRPFYAFKIRFNIEKVENADGQPYGKVRPEIVAPVDDLEDGKAILELQQAFREFLRNRPVVNDDSSEPADSVVING